MKNVFIVLLVIAAAFWISSCSDEPPVSPENRARIAADLPGNPSNPVVPEATVPLLTFATPKDAITISDLADPAILTPENLSATLWVGQSVTESKNLYLPPNVTPRKLDLLVSFDLTGSMGGELANVKVNSVNIMNAIKGVIPDSKFGVMSHMDYPGTFGGCGYGPSIYGNGADPCGDYAYSLDQPLTATSGDVATAINGLSLGCGYDGPEDYTRVFNESYSDPSIVWRAGAKKIVLAFLDAVPHDCAFDSILGGGGSYISTGPDPGRDATVGTGDDLKILEVLDEMASENITLIVLYSGGNSGSYSEALWDAYCQKTGGEAFQINDDGTIPGGMDIADFIAGLVEESIVHFDEVTLEACDPAYAGWVTMVDPASYTNIDLGEDINLGFDLTITVPPGTAEGEYCFDICAVGDDVELATQEVCITVRSEVGFDFHPTSCPNPFNMTLTGISPAAILGADDFDVTMIDPATVRLEGIAPVRWAYQDVSTPYEPFTGKDDCMDCNTLGPDGFVDLTLKFDGEALAAALAGVQKGECRVVTVVANLKPEFGGGAIGGEDVLKIIIPPVREAKGAKK